ncbi:TerB family tellurite resistance protein [Phaeovulum sp.]|uniref:tellurite resistance TerB family protein n=1 Tax=Phaeovulum sp. TaxID=2934796 RepID=UPI00273013F7|nr:TerB family tellurite resistance protein [Phaeovulum sp.]MDP1669418.1 TerB family tellurite resistance protein [Phaeovulum sp.]MDP2062335.1 TerB family tellurite resistance protein [Phaeovulum sp.]MDZ4119688.1 TerB family tellurite resistance protein [Phaeovulum sp.]
MLKAILKRLLAPAPEAPNLPEREVALAALMVRIARADGAYDDAEKVRIERVLALRDGLAEDEAKTLRESAEEIEAEAADTVRFTRMLKAMVPLEDRSGVIEALWEVALADGHRSADEEAQIRLAANLLGVNDRDSALARRRVRKRLG